MDKNLFFTYCNLIFFFLNHLTTRVLFNRPPVVFELVQNAVQIKLNKTEKYIITNK